MLSKLTRGLGITLVATSLLLVLSACADTPGGEETTEETTGPVKVGAILPLTGDGAAYGDPMQKVAQIALEKVNANGQKLEFIWEDGKCNGADAANAARKLIEVDKVQIIYGGFCSSETLAIAPIAEKAGVVVFSPASSSPDITTAGDYIFRNYPSDSSQAKILAQEANRKGYKKVAVLSEQNDYTLALAKAFTETFTSLGGEVEAQTFLASDSDFRTALLKLKSGEADALFINPQTPAKADLAFKQLEEMGWEVALIGNDVVAGYQDLISKFASTVEGMLVAEFSFNRNNPEFIALKEKFKEKTGEDLPYETYASTVYDAVFITNEALEAVGNDGSALKEYFYGIHGRAGLGGLLTIDENGDPKAGHALEVVKDGKVVSADSDAMMEEEEEETEKSEETKDTEDTDTAEA